jgi:ribosomal protein L44E
LGAFFAAAPQKTGLSGAPRDNLRLSRSGPACGVAAPHPSYPLREAAHAGLLPRLSRRDKRKLSEGQRRTNGRKMGKQDKFIPIFRYFAGQTKRIQVKFETFNVNVRKVSGKNSSFPSIHVSP